MGTLFGRQPTFFIIVAVVQARAPLVDAPGRLAVAFEALHAGYALFTLSFSVFLMIGLLVGGLEDAGRS